MAKQTFTTGQVLTALEMTNLQQTAMGGGSTTAKTASYVLVAADAGTVVQMNSATATSITLNTALFAAGDTVQIQNVGAGVCTVTAGTATVNTSATLALKQYDAGTLYFNTTSAAFFFAVDAADTPLTTTGDIIYSSSGSTAARLGIGSASQVLTVSGGIPSWATPSSGAVVQVKNATYSTQTIVSSSTFADSGLTLAITPTSASNKILVFVTHSGCGKYNSNTALQVRLLRGSTTIANIESAAGSDGGTGENMIGSIAANYLDSPATTSATTYKTQINSRANTGSAYYNDGTSPGSTSTITLMEVTP